MGLLPGVMHQKFKLLSIEPFGPNNFKPLYDILEIHKVSDIYRLKIAKIVYKQDENLLPVNLANYFEEFSTTTSNCTSS